MSLICPINSSRSNQSSHSWPAITFRTGCCCSFAPGALKKTQTNGSFRLETDLLPLSHTAHLVGTRSGWRCPVPGWAYLLWWSEVSLEREKQMNTAPGLMRFGFFLHPYSAQPRLPTLELANTTSHKQICIWRQDWPAAPHKHAAELKYANRGAPILAQEAWLGGERVGGKTLGARPLPVSSNDEVLSDEGRAVNMVAAISTSVSELWSGMNCRRFVPTYRVKMPSSGDFGV
ncbi:hypothetical protein AOLI_G00118940 [Acnodon oligacanthus]